MGCDGRTRRKLERYGSLFEDDFYVRCLQVASGSAGTGERYGSLLVRDGDILGEGRNRRVSKPDFVPRIVRQGYANHAEVEALNAALMREADGFKGLKRESAFAGELDPEEFSSARGADIYVAGYFAKGGFLDIRDGPLFTCRRCPKVLDSYGIGRIFTPTPQGWASLTVDEAEECSLDFKAEAAGGILRKRLKAGRRNVTLDELLWYGCAGTEKRKKE